MIKRCNLNLPQDLFDETKRISSTQGTMSPKENMKMDEASKRNLERIKLQIDGSYIMGVGRVDMENVDHVILAAYLVAKDESRESHHEELMEVMDMF